MAQTVKNMPAMQETGVPSLGWEDPRKKGMTTHSNILAWRIPWTKEPGGLWSMGWQESDPTEQLTLSLYFHFISQMCPASLPHPTAELQSGMEDLSFVRLWLNGYSKPDPENTWEMRAGRVRTPSLCS